MQDDAFGRRGALIAAGALGATLAGQADAQHSVRWSTGTAAPRTSAPPAATDCHFHVYDARFPAAPSATLFPQDASPEDYRALQRRIGTSRGVLVQPSTYGTDNRLHLQAMRELGPERFRMVAVVDPTVEDAELRRMQDAGVRGIRFNLGAQAGATTLEMMEPLARRVAPLGWHIQVNMDAPRILAAAELLARLPTPLVFDHLAQIPREEGADGTAFALVRRLLDTGRVWVKLSGAYYLSRSGPPGYADSVALGRALHAANPERMVWGSDWPHVTIADPARKPDDAALFDVLAETVPDDAARARVLVANPAALYGFPPG